MNVDGAQRWRGGRASYRPAGEVIDTRRFAVDGPRVGCELGEESAEVARMRLQHAYALPREDGDAPVVTRVGGQGKLF